MPYPHGADGAALLLLAVTVGGLAVVLAVRRGRAAGTGPHFDPADPWAGVPTAVLDLRAADRLVEADNALRAAEQELGFAVARYGRDGTRAYAAAVDAARMEAAEAFSLRQRLDDAYPQEEPAQRATLVEIIDRCVRSERLSAEAFTAEGAGESYMDRLTLDLPLGDVGLRRNILRRKLCTVADLLADLRARYAAPAFEAVDDNVEQASSRLGFANRELDKAARAIAIGDRSDAAFAIRRAEQALGQAADLLGAIDRLGADLRAAEGRVHAVLTRVQAAVAARKAAVPVAVGAWAVGRTNPAAAVAWAEQVAIAVGADLAGTHPDPIGSLSRIVAAAADLDADDATATPEHAERARALLDPGLFSARTAVDAADLFVTVRRGAVRHVARTRLTEARRHLAEATRPDDPVAALAAARRATVLAKQAMAAARADLGNWQGGYGRPVVVGGAILGGIVPADATSGRRSPPAALREGSPR